MVVKCVKTSIVTNNQNVINNDLDEFLVVGTEYIVYGIRIFDGFTYFMIFDDGHLVEVPSDMFVLVEKIVSPLWIVNDEKHIGLTFWPKLFYESNFFEKFSEWNDIERIKFEELRNQFEIR